MAITIPTYELLFPATTLLYINYQCKKKNSVKCIFFA